MIVNCGQLTANDVGKNVEVYGWCRYKRDHGGKLFIDLADRYGITQLVFEGKVNDSASELGKEYVIKVNGSVRKRSQETIDKDNPTGTVEVYVEDYELINASLLPPFELIDEKKKFLANEDLRMKYRYLDLRRKEMIKRVEFRDRVTKTIRKFLWDNGFMELETPTLVKDTYETGSRTFLVPSRTNPGKFYALAQSPQMYKQLCMISGLDKYFQVAHAFRDEDPREDRQPEHTQIDLEVSFKDEEYIQGLIEGLLAEVFEKSLGKKIGTPFKHMDYFYAMENYGSDKPDLRFDSKIVDITNEIADSDYKIVKRVIENKGKVRAVAFAAGFGTDKPILDKQYMLRLIETAKSLGLAGLTWLYVKNGVIASEPESISETLKKVEQRIIVKLDAKDGDVILMCSDVSDQLLLSVLGKIRKEVGRKIGKFSNEYEILWVDGFPLFEKDEVTNQFKPSHNPFTSPNPSTVRYMESEPEKVIGRQYDLVINGEECGGGSIRISNPDIQKAVFKTIGMTDEQIERTFGFMVEALRYGAPIHGGIALGLDRLLTILSNESDIREFILFPKNKKYESPIDGSPTDINDKRLKDDYGILTGQM